ASNKAEGPVERLGLLFYLLSVGERSPEEDKSAGSGFERCAATARRVAGRTPAINCQASNKAESSVGRLSLLFLRFNKNPVPKGAGFFAVWGMPPGGAALTGATDPEPQNLVRSTVSRQTTMPVRYYQQ
ncbi:hypothetical protein, partial [Klebsiella quasipneumoniae]|uniref:hypothetical protein n=3 Tax=Klebsiella quasipneumoniae TaxID=1463165 RepID=UPI001D0D54CB